MVLPAGFEPAIYGLEDRCLIHWAMGAHLPDNNRIFLERRQSDGGFGGQAHSFPFSNSLLERSCRSLLRFHPVERRGRNQDRLNKTRLVNKSPSPCFWLSFDLCNIPPAGSLSPLILSESYGAITICRHTLIPARKQSLRQRNRMTCRKRSLIEINILIRLSSAIAAV